MIYRTTWARCVKTRARFANSYSLKEKRHYKGVFLLFIIPLYVERIGVERC